MTNGFEHNARQRVKESRVTAPDTPGAAERHREIVLDAERSVLAAMMLGADAIQVARTIITAPDFYRSAHGRVFAAILALADRAERPDLVTVNHELSQRGELALVGGPVALAMIMDYAACTANVGVHARIVWDAAQRRRARDLFRMAEQQASDPTIPLAEMLTSVQDGLAAVAVSDGAADRFATAAVNAVEFVERQIEKPRSLIDDGLLVAGGFGILYGAPGLGKSWLGIEAARALVRGEPWVGIATDPGGCRVGLLQLELPAWYMKRRLQTLELGNHERDGNLHIVCRPYLRGAVDLFADGAEVGRLRRWIERKRLDVLIIDALSRAHTADENAATEMGTVLARLDALRHDTGCAIFAIHHERKQMQNGEGSDLDALRGSSRLQSDPTALIRVKEVGGLRCVTFPKVSFGPAPTDIFFVIGEDGAPVIVEAPGEVAGKNCEQIYAALEAADCALSRAEVEKATGFKKPTVARHLATLVAAGRVAVVGPEDRPTYTPSHRLTPSHRDAETASRVGASHPSHPVSETSETGGRLGVSPGLSPTGRETPRLRRAPRPASPGGETPAETPERRNGSEVEHDGVRPANAILSDDARDFARRLVDDVLREKP